MDENTYTVTITPNDFNAFITANGDGTYNVTYANLQDEQITAIGQEFANRLIDTDENGNPKTGLHKVALTGNYSQLENKPNASNLQGFHSVAFSGNTSELNNDKGFLTTATNAYTGSTASTITPELITSWNNKGTSNFSGNYEDLNGAPVLPEDIGDNREAYYTINEGEIDEERKIKPLKLVAFTNDYNHLNNKPNNLYTFLNLQNFSNTILPTESSKIQTLGENNVFILNFKGFKNNNNYLLSEAIKNLVTNYYNYSKEFIIMNSIRRYKILNINRILLDDNENNISLISMDYVAFNKNNYIDIQYDNSNNDFNGTIAENQLSNLQITPQIGTLIFDYQNDVIYCKINNI